MEELSPDQSLVQTVLVKSTAHQTSLQVRASFGGDMDRFVLCGWWDLVDCISLRCNDQAEDDMDTFVLRHLLRQPAVGKGS